MLIPGQQGPESRGPSQALYRAPQLSMARRTRKANSQAFGVGSEDCLPRQREFEMRPSTDPKFRKILALTVLAWFSWGCSAPPEPGRSHTSKAPDFNLNLVDGGQLRLSEYRGKVVLLHFWATWCPPCTAAIPHENELQDKYGHDGFTVLGLSVDRKPEDVRDFLEDTTVKYPVAMVDDSTREAYGGVPTVPLTILVDRQGTIRKTKIGFTSRDVAAFERRIVQLLGEG